MEVEKFRERMWYILGIIIPFWLSITTYGLLQKSLTIEFLFLFGFACILLIISSFLLTIAKPICKCHWKRKHKSRLRKSIIGIIGENQLDVDLNHLKFSREYWANLVRENERYEIRFISALDITQISDDLVAIINPYNGCYPEVDITEKKSFKRIKEYVKNGGIFVNVCNFPFYNAWNKTVGKLSTAKEVYGFTGGIIKNPIKYKNGKPIETYNVGLQPSYKPDPQLSLIDTLAFNELGLLTTTGDVDLRYVYQNEEDNEFENILNRIDNPFIYEFRATRKPTQNFKPMLRSRIYLNENKFVEIYPIAFIPYDDGKFLFAGMMMDKGENKKVILSGDETRDIPPINSTYDNILINQTKMIFNALDILIEQEKDDYRINQNNREQNNPQDDGTNILNCRM